jgi:hypothetical protein
MVNPVLHLLLCTEVALQGMFSLKYRNHAKEVSKALCCTLQVLSCALPATCLVRWHVMYYAAIVCAAAPLANPLNGAFSCSSTSKPGTVCTATCSAGFAGSPNVTCLQDGSWSSQIVGECVRGERVHQLIRLGVRSDCALLKLCGHSTCKPVRHACVA